MAILERIDEREVVAGQMNKNTSKDIKVAIIEDLYSLIINKHLENLNEHDMFGLSHDDVGAGKGKSMMSMFHRMEAVRVPKLNHHEVGLPRSHLKFI